MEPLRLSIVEYFEAKSSMTRRHTWDYRESLLLCLGSTTGTPLLLKVSPSWAISPPAFPAGPPMAAAVEAGVRGLATYEL